MDIVRLALLLTVFALFCVHGNLSADDADEPRQFSDDEVKAADDLRLTLSTDQQTLYNGLRYLMQPEFENELLEGRRRRPSTLEPFEHRADTPLTLLENLRLWAVIRSGMKATPAMDRQLQRFIDTPVTADNTNLAPLGVMAALAREAWRRPDLGRQTDLKFKLEAILKVANDRTDATSARSSLIRSGRIDAQWYANHLWRALTMRAALEMEIEVDVRLWASDLKALSDARQKDNGWVVHKDVVRSAAYDLHTNLMAIAAVNLAAGVADDTLRRNAAKTVERMTARIPEVIERLVRDYGDVPWYGGRLLVALSLGEGVSPEGISPGPWRAELLRAGVALRQPEGFVLPGDSMARELGLYPSTWSRQHGVDCETALTCLAATGGLYSTEDGPLKGRDLASVGLLMHAFTVLHASSAAAFTGDFQGRVNLAIREGCEYIESTQNEDGSFPGQYGGHAGNTALCVLALMHGGWDTRHPAVQRGIEWLLDPVNERRCRTYDYGCILMCLQKYHEGAQRKAGILYVTTPAEFERARADVWRQLGEAHRALVNRAIKHLNESRLTTSQGGWSYTPGIASAANPFTDNSNSQYAMLGYKAASLLGAQIDTSLFIIEAERLIKQYSPDEGAEPVEYVHEPDEREVGKSRTASESRESIKPGGWAYQCAPSGAGITMQMTAAGMGSLTVCMDELKVRGKLNVKLARKIGLTIRGAEAAVRKHYHAPEDFEGPRNPMAMRTSDGRGIYYNLYSVERGCVMTGIRKLEGEVDWYRIGAEALIANQNLDGGWGSDVDMPAGQATDRRQMVNTCLAILFLKQASMPVITEHKKREQRETGDDPSSPITPGPEDRKK